MRLARGKASKRKLHTHRRDAETPRRRDAEKTEESESFTVLLRILRQRPGESDQKALFIGRYFSASRRLCGEISFRQKKKSRRRRSGERRSAVGHWLAATRAPAASGRSVHVPS